MRLTAMPRIMLVLSPMVLLDGCGSDTGAGPVDDEPVDLFPSQAYSDDFDSGNPGARWGCAAGACSWEVIQAGPLDLETAQATTGPGPANFVFQSPDPLALDLNRSQRCVGFPAEFTQPGTFAFNYFVNTGGPVGFQDGNNLEVSVWSHTVEYDPDFGEDIIVSSERSVVLEQSGQSSSRFQQSLPAGYYDFEFCYVRNRTANIGPDFVQIDDVATCTGTGCAGEIPPAPRCRADEGQILVPDISRLPTHVITIKRVQGTADRYYVIVNATILEFVSGGVASMGSQYDELQSEIDSVLTVTYVDGKTCDIDERRSLLIEMSQAEIIDYVLATGLLSDALDELEQAFWDWAGDAAVNAAIQKAQEYMLGKILEWIGKLLASLI